MFQTREAVENDDIRLFLLDELPQGTCEWQRKTRVALWQTHFGADVDAFEILWEFVAFSLGVFVRFLGVTHQPFAAVEFEIEVKHLSRPAFDLERAKAFAASKTVRDLRRKHALARARFAIKHRHLALVPHLTA